MVHVVEFGSGKMQQDIKAAVRPVLYQTDNEDWPYSYGGSLFVVNFKNRCYGITCYHVIGDEGANHIFVASGPNITKGMNAPAIEKVARVKDDKTDLRDIAIIFFSSEISPSFFDGTAYVINPNTIGSSETGHRLKVYGFLTEKTHVDVLTKTITGGYCDLQFSNVGPTSFDPFITQALATYKDHNFSSLDGISGAPVFDETIGQLCGMVVRAGLDDGGGATMWYIDVFHIHKLLEAVHAGSL